MNRLADLPLFVFLARAAGTDWASLDSRKGRVEVRGQGALVRWHSGRSSRDLDAGLLRSVERGRLVRIEERTLRRWPRTARNGVREVLAYVDPAAASERIVLGFSAPCRLPHDRVEELVRLLLASRASHPEPPPRAVDVHTACATHDLRHLLTVAGLELERAAAEAPGGGALARAQAALASARSLCDRSAGTARLRIRPVLESVARDASLASRRSERVEVRVAAPAELVAILDRGLFERAVRNLVQNAIEATPDGGSVEVEATTDLAGEIRITVRDEGRGIAEEDVEDLLRPGRSASGGSGYGTASIRACVRELGGKLLVRSRPRAGTEFLVRLPLARRS